MKIILCSSIISSLDDFSITRCTPYLKSAHSLRRDNCNAMYYMCSMYVDAYTHTCLCNGYIDTNNIECKLIKDTYPSCKL